MSGEGSLGVRLGVAGGHVAEVEIDFERPGRVTRALAGKAPEEVRTLVPLLFSVCSAAQAVACARALEAALGEPPAPRLDTVREAVCLAEACASHVWQLGLAWRDAAGAPQDVPRVARARRALGELELALFGVPSIGPSLRSAPAWGDARAALETLAGLVNELAASETALEAAVRAADRAGFAVTAHPMVAAPPPATVAASLAADPTFAERPVLDGRPVEVSAYARHRGNEAVRAAVVTHGEGLLARLVARRAAALADVELARARLADAERAAPVELAGLAARAAPGEGTGCAPTARGPLLHWVRASAGRVDELVSVSPTDWTFHPRGVVRAALAGRVAGPSLARDAGWLVLALDACVPWSIEVRDA